MIFTLPIILSVLSRLLVSRSPRWGTQQSRLLLYAPKQNSNKTGSRSKSSTSCFIIS